MEMDTDTNLQIGIKSMDDYEGWWDEYLCVLGTGNNFGRANGGGIGRGFGDAFGKGSRNILGSQWGTTGLDFTNNGNGAGSGNDSTEWYVCG